MSDFALKRPAPKLQREPALDEVRKILEFYDYNIGDLQDGPVKNQATESLETLTRAFMDGSLEINETAAEFTVTQNLKKSPKVIGPINYGQFRGDAKLILDKVPAGETYKRIDTLLAYLGKTDISAFKSMDAVDLATAEALGFLFLSK
jgi:hypothetical protein